MDFGVLGWDELVGPENGAPSISHKVSLVPETKPKVLGSKTTKQKRSGSCEDDRRYSKMPRTGNFSVTKTMSLHQGTPLLRSNDMVSSDNTDAQQQQMLSFSSNKSEVSFLSRNIGLVNNSSQITGFPYYQNTSSSSAYTRISGYGSGSFNPSMHVPFSGSRGHFTQSQIIELDQQLWILRHIMANAAVPSNLLNYLKKPINPYGLSYPSAGSSYIPSYGWGTFSLGYSGSNDAEPGRCRRTDGKKWRCSRDAVPEQKYCERHMNRGRHRSRKLVEGPVGRATTGTTNSNVVPKTSSISSSVTSGIASTMPHQLKNLQPGAANSSTDALVIRENVCDTVQNQPCSIEMSSTINQKSKASTFSIPNQDLPSEGLCRPVFGFVSSDSLLNPSQNSSFLNSKSYDGSFLDFSDQESQDQHPLRQFFDPWPKGEPEPPVITWPEDFNSDWTQLSMSIPMTNSEFSSSASSPAHEKFVVSPLRLSHDFDPVQMGSEVNNYNYLSMQKQSNWASISFGYSMGGGPLGEALANPVSSIGTCKNQPSLNLLTEGWDSSSQLGSSPTGVLQTTTFCSLSNSSSVSSPIADNKRLHDGASLSDDVLGSTQQVHRKKQQQHSSNRSASEKPESI
ncbi:hypothetical protein Dsin_015720 [Dipteronia sinensis]|uniref:Growth-regulating factor n=1 Tax=Dipteronia sinensis TaxID=43782 RepID=A0AAE0ABU3_9ROSI|nr:hypothetical protein Dsin_015720 [Dipteronia sinensis]